MDSASPLAVRIKHSPLFLPGLILIAALVRACIGLYLGFRPLDDTYITFRYALNIATGHGFVYNWNQHILGTTTPLWTLVMAAVLFLKLPVAISALVLSLLADVVTALLIYSLLLRLQFSKLIALSAALLFLCLFDYFSIARSGMETAFFVLLVVATLHELAALRFRCAGLLCGLACITRPEGTILVGIGCIILWLHRKQVKRADVFVGAVLWLLVAGGWAMFAQHYFGSVVPQSVKAKASGSHDPYLAAVSWYHILTFFVKGQWGGAIFQNTYLQLSFVFTIFSLIATLHLVMTSLKQQAQHNMDRVVILLLFPCCYGALLSLSHAFTWYPWYYGPLYPFSAMLTVIGVAHVGQQWKLPHQQMEKTVGFVTAGLMLSQLAAALLVKLPNAPEYWVQGYFRVAESIPKSPKIEVASIEIGALGWQTWPATIFDLWGLVTPEAVGHSADALAKSLAPDYLVIRIDDSHFLEQARSERWFAKKYKLIAAVQSPYEKREFCTYQLQPVYAMQHSTR